MARTVITYTAEVGRDKGKKFVITEMSAFKCESWAARALIAILGGNAETPESLTDLSTAQLAEFGLKAFGSLKWDVAKPLLDEMMGCVQFMPDPKAPQILRHLLPDDEDIEEVATLVMLKGEVLKMHTAFFMNALQSAFPGVSLPRG